MPSDTLPPNEQVLALLIRHGATKLNDPQKPRLRGWDNPPLNDEGRFAVLLTANKTKIYRPKMVWSSDLARDSESAILYAELMGNIPYDMDFALRTSDMGTMTAMPEEDVRERVLRWYQRPYEPAPGGESFNVWSRRYWLFLEPKIELVRESPAFRPIAFFTHGRNIAYLDSYYRGIPPEEGRTSKPGEAAILKSTYEGQDFLEFLGETEPIATDV